MNKRNAAVYSQATAVGSYAAASGTSSAKILLLLSLVTLLPTTIFYILATSSQAPGVAVVALAVLGLAALQLVNHPNTRQTISALLVVALTLLGILSHGLVAYYFQPLDFTRMLQSLLLFGLMLVGSYFLRFAIFDSSDKDIQFATTGVFIIFLVVGVAGVLEIRPIQSVTSFNPVFPFTEPSHYALTFTPILLFACVSRGLAFRLAALMSALAIAYLLQSLSLIVGIVLVGLVTLPLPYLAVTGVALSIAIGILDVTYFTDRLDLNYDSGNLSVLVYLQGWELATDSIARTSGWGIGFQQLGFGPINSPTADVILRLAGNDTNLKDGGFTLAKATSEFGAFGFVAIVLFGALAGRVALILRNVALRRNKIQLASVLAMSIICGYAVEAFIRGIGYFSGSTMLLLASILYVNGNKFSILATAKTN